MKLWEKGFSTENIVESYTVGNDRSLDLHLAKYDVLGSKAHARMLAKIGILTSSELHNIQDQLDVLLGEIEAGVFTIGEEFEDVHSKVEHDLVAALGEAGKKIHTARSRNDQVLVDLHLFAKAEIKELTKQIKLLFDTLLELAETHKNVLMPGYTHMQVAMPSSFGLWFSAFAETLIDDVIQLKATFKIADQNPLGSAAGYGSSFPIDRDLTTELLDFSHLKINVIAAQYSRGRLEKSMAFSIAQLGSTLGKLANDICLYVNQNFDFISFPKELTTGSSIMPHKKNPDVFELMRAYCNQAQNLPNELTLLTSNLATGYHRDFQLLKESLFKALFQMRKNIEVCNYMLQHIQVNTKALDDDIYDYLYTVDDLNKMVQAGMPFRDAYKKLGLQVEEGTYVPNKKVQHTHKGSLGNLCLKDIRNKWEHLAEF